MKKIVLKLSFGLLSAFLLFSCLDENDDIFVSYGVIQNMNSTNSYEILTDKGNVLMVTKSLTSQEIENDKRVLVNYEVLSDKDKNKNVFEIKVNGFYNLLTKPVVNESYILKDEEARRDSVGNDPFNAISARFGGDFINIDFELLHSQSSEKKHMINLVYDDTQSNMDTLCLTLYHNAYGEVPGEGLYLYRGVGRCSFKISDLLPQGVSSIPVKLMWTEYDNNNKPKERSGTDVFKLGNTSENNKSLSRDVKFDTHIEIK